MKISVVIPCYNSEKYIIDTIQSIISQGDIVSEILVVDDCSSDSSADIVMSLSTEESRIKLLKMKKNSGPAAARNVGISAATSEYIAFMDSDDLCVAGRFRLQLEKLLNEEADVCVSSLKNFGMGQTHVSFVASTHQSLQKISLLKCPFPQPSVIGKSHVFKNNLYDESLFSEDYDLWVKLLPKYKFVSIKEPLLLGRNRSDNLSKLSECRILTETCGIRRNAISFYGFDKNIPDSFDEAFLGKLKNHTSLKDAISVINDIFSFGYSDYEVYDAYKDQVYWIFRRNIHLGFSLYLRSEISSNFRYFGLIKEFKLFLSLVRSMLSNKFSLSR